MTKNATFLNFDVEPFTGYWNGKPKTFRPGEKVHMSASLAEHFAKHLTNKVLIREGKETATSPKFPAQVPQFMEVFRKAFIPDSEAIEDGSVDDAISQSVEPSMDIQAKKPSFIDQGPAAALAAEAPVGPGDGPQIIGSPDDESNFAVGT